MRSKIFFKTIDKWVELKCEGNDVVLRVNKIQVARFDIADVWDLITDRMAKLSYSTDPGLLRRAYAAKQLNKSYEKFIKEFRHKEE